MSNHLGTYLLTFAVAACGGSTARTGGDAGPGAPDGGTVSDGGVTADGGATCASPPSAPPPPRSETMGVVDPTRGRLVFFGGDDGVPERCNPAPHPIGELWTYDLACRVFTQLPSENGPPGRARGMAVIDTRRDRMIVFGGRFRSARTGPYQLFNDVWALSLATLSWQRIETRGGPPPARSSPAGGYNPTTDEMIVFGGNASTSGLSFAPLDDVWALNLDTGTWRRIQPGNAGPSPRLFHAAAVDPEANRLFVYGGGGANAFQGPFYGDLWALDVAQGTWDLLHDSGRGAPNARIGSTIAFDGPRSRLLLFAGHDDQAVGNNNDTWSFDLQSRQWRNLIPPETVNQPAGGFCDFPPDFTLVNRAAPDRRSAHLAALDPVRGEWFVFGGKTDCGLINDVWSFRIADGVWNRLTRATAGEACRRYAETCTTMCN